MYGSCIIMMSDFSLYAVASAISCASALLPVFSWKTDSCCLFIMIYGAEDIDRSWGDVSGGAGGRGGGCWCGLDWGSDRSGDRLGLYCLHNVGVVAEVFPVACNAFIVFSGFGGGKKT